MEESIITPHASQPQIILATFKCNTTTSDFPRRPQCLVPPIALSTGRRWNTPRDAAASWCLASIQRLLANDLQANHNSIFFYCAENATNINCIRFPASKNQIRTKGNEKRFSLLSYNSLISSAQLVPSMALAHRSSAPLLALAHLPLAQHSYASDHVFSCP